jgi:starvation-inducible outer membrane lipoprotein
MLHFASLLLFLSALAGCAPAISPQARGQAVPTPVFADLQAHPEKYQGQTLILGGLIMSVKPYKDGSLLLVDQRPLDPRNQPLRGSASGGTFAVASDQWLTSSFYVSQRAVTVTGVVEGRLDGAPVLKAVNIDLGEYEPWEEYYYPIPRQWYDYDRSMEHWYTPPYFDPRRPGRAR